MTNDAAGERSWPAASEDWPGSSNAVLGISVPRIPARYFSWLGAASNVPVSKAKPHEDHREFIRGWVFHDVDEVDRNECPKLVAQFQREALCATENSRVKANSNSRLTPKASRRESFRGRSHHFTNGFVARSAGEFADCSLGRRELDIADRNAMMRDGVSHLSEALPVEMPNGTAFCCGA